MKWKLRKNSVSICINRETRFVAGACTVLACEVFQKYSGSFCFRLKQEVLTESLACSHQEAGPNSPGNVDERRQHFAGARTVPAVHPAALDHGAAAVVRHGDEEPAHKPGGEPGARRTAGLRARRSATSWTHCMCKSRWQPASLKLGWTSYTPPVPTVLLSEELCLNSQQQTSSVPWSRPIETRLLAQASCGRLGRHRDRSGSATVVRKCWCEICRLVFTFKHEKLQFHISAAYLC